MLKRSFSTFPRFLSWILLWTLISWLLFLPGRILSLSLFEPMNLDFTLVKPGNPYFFMTLLDHLENAYSGFSGLILISLISGLASVLFTLGVVPALSQSITNSRHGERIDNRQILGSWPAQILPVFWRFLVWALLTVLLLSGTTLTFENLTTTRIILILVVVEWALMLSWLTHILVLWGSGEKKCMRRGLARLFTHTISLIYGVFFWVILGGSALLIQYFQTRLTLMGTTPLIFSQVLFLIAIFLVHCGKFLWVANHSLPPQSVQFLIAETGMQPPVRRFQP